MSNKINAALAVLLLLLALPAIAEEMHPQLVPNGFQAITALSEATGLSVPAGSTSAMICVETDTVVWRDDGPAPTSTSGMAAPAGLPCWLYSGSLSAIKFIAQTPANAPAIDVSFYR